jgi:hypothetical protein
MRSDAASDVDVASGPLPATDGPAPEYAGAKIDLIFTAVQSLAAVLPPSRELTAAGLVRVRRRPP